MDVGRRRGGVKTSVIAGSVWESRMKHDEVKGGIKVFNGETNNNEEDNNNNVGDCSSPSSRKLVKRSPVGPSAKRKTWKSESCDGPIQIAKGKTDSSSLVVENCEEQSRELSVSVDGGVSKKSLNFSARRGRSDGSTGLSVSVDGIDKRLILGKKVRSGDNEKNPVQMRSGRSDIKEIVDSQLRKVKSDSVSSEKKSIKSKTEIKERSDDSGGDGIIEKNSPQIEENGSEESCKEFGVCQEKVISSNETYPDDDDDDDEFEGDDDEGDDKINEEMEVEIEIEKKSVDDMMEILNVQEEKPKMKVQTKPPPSPSPPPLPPPQEQKPKKVAVNEDIRSKVHQFRNRAAPPTPPTTVNKQPPPVFRRAAIYQNLSKPTSTPFSNNEHQNCPERHNKLQNIVDLVMWRDIARSAFVFGIGTFIIVSSSYTKDLNVSFISVMSYVGLVYLALIFLYRSLIHRGVINIEDRRYVVGEEEAVWLIKLVLPYLNECLWKIRALFSGDPATTMKMAVLLFVLARCGASITIWKMAKLGFFGVFTVPKVCSSYSTQLTAYAKFWIRRFRDAWESCAHKKAVTLAIFTLVWNLSSMVARVWAVFILYVAVRYYQRSMELDDGEDWVVEDENGGHDEAFIGHKQNVGSGATASTEVNKVKKWS